MIHLSAYVCSIICATIVGLFFSTVVVGTVIASRREDFRPLDIIACALFGIFCCVAILVVGGVITFY